jgi:hypothetical protein
MLAPSSVSGPTSSYWNVPLDRCQSNSDDFPKTFLMPRTYDAAGACSDLTPPTSRPTATAGPTRHTASSSRHPPCPATARPSPCRRTIAAACLMPRRSSRPPTDPMTGSHCGPCPASRTIRPRRFRPDPMSVCGCQLLGVDTGHYYRDPPVGTSIHAPWPKGHTHRTSG